MNRPFVLIGNKCDLENKRVVTTKEGEKKATKHRVCFFEIKKIYQKLLKQLFKKCTKTQKMKEPTL